MSSNDIITIYICVTQEVFKQNFEISGSQNYILNYQMIS